MSSGTFPVERTAVLTGAASPRGIGRALADRLAGEGWAVAILDLDADASRQAADDIAARHGVRVVGVAADVTDEKSVDEAISAVEEQLPPVVALGNLAGISDPSPFLEVTLEEWERVFAVNVRGAFLTTRRVLPGMIDQHLGRIVCVSSISAQRGGGTFSKVPYSASKAALLGFTRAVAREVGEYGVTVNAVAPGPIDTDIMGGTLTDERRAQLAAGSLVGRIGTPAEVAALMAYLMGPDAGFITAATYDINGGLQIS